MNITGIIVGIIILFFVIALIGILGAYFYLMYTKFKVKLDNQKKQLTKKEDDNEIVDEEDCKKETN